MAIKSRKRKPRKAKGKVKVKQSVRLRQKNDTTSNDGLKKVASRPPSDAGANFEVTIKKKRK